MFAQGKKINKKASLKDQKIRAQYEFEYNSSSPVC